IQRYAPQPHLHSFPTRRSSDLSPVLMQAERDAWRPGEEIFEPIGPTEKKSAPPPQCPHCKKPMALVGRWRPAPSPLAIARAPPRSEEHTSELQSRSDLVCRLLL